MRRNFLFAFHYWDACVPSDFDYKELAELAVKERLGNAFSFWPDHTYGRIHWPTHEDMKRWGLASIWYFYTEDIYNPKLAEDWGYPDTASYNDAMVQFILEQGRALGKDWVFWSVGHEHFDDVRQWCMQPDGSQKDLRFRNKHEGYEFYRRWITTKLHQLHWRKYGGELPPKPNPRRYKFPLGWDPGEPTTWEYLKEKGIDTSPVTMMSGGVTAVLAHAAFDILLQIEMYWWECPMSYTSLQIGTAYLRGAARQYGKGWLMDVTPWSGNIGRYPRDSIGGDLGPMYTPFMGEFVENLSYPRPDCYGRRLGGVPDKQQIRAWIYGYLSGADVVFQESSAMTHFYKHEGRLVLSETGLACKKAANFIFDLCPERGEPYCPVALLLEHEHGVEPTPNAHLRLGNNAWGYIPFEDGDYMIDLFFKEAFPGHSQRPKPPPWKDTTEYGEWRLAGADEQPYEARAMHGSTFGDCFEVLTKHCKIGVLKHYPRIFLLGSFNVTPETLAKLKAFVEDGGQVSVNAAQLSPEVEDDPFWGAKLGIWIDGKETHWMQSKEPLDACPYRYRIATPTTAISIAESETGRPLILKNGVGKGEVYLTTPYYLLCGEKPFSRMRLATHFLHWWIEPVWPLKVQTVNDELPQKMLNKLDDGWIVTLGNHSESDWYGIVKLMIEQLSAEDSSIWEKSLKVIDLWKQAPLPFHVEGETVWWRAYLPRFSLTVYRVKLP